MEIRFTQDYKDHKKGEIIDVFALKGKLLLKQGVAEIAPEHWLVRDLVVADIIKAKTITNNEASIDGEFVHKGIFYHLKDRTGNIGMHVYRIPDEFVHCLTRINYQPSEKQDYAFFDNNDLGKNFVNAESVQSFSNYFFKLMVDCGMNRNTYLTREQIQQLEVSMNEKDNDLQIEDRDCW